MRVRAGGWEVDGVGSSRCREGSRELDAVGSMMVGADGTFRETKYN